MAKNQHTLNDLFKRILQGMSVHQKLSVILENKVVQKLSLEKIYLPKNGPLNWYF